MTATDVTLPPPGAAVEVATWRPLEVVTVDGWHVGRSGGFTRRGNRAWAEGEPADPGAALERVETLYAPGRAVVRVDAASRPTGLDDVLAARGYARVADTLVMARATAPDAGDDGEGDAGDLALPPASRLEVTDAPDGAWLAAWLGVKAAGAVDHGLARALLVGAPAAYLTARDDDGEVGVLRAAWAGDWVGLSCLVTAPRARRRGVGRALTATALAEACRRGVPRAFLQVEATNAPARALYARLGFAVVDRYHYRER